MQFDRASLFRRTEEAVDRVSLLLRFRELLDVGVSSAQGIRNVAHFVDTQFLGRAVDVSLHVPGSSGSLFWDWCARLPSFISKSGDLHACNDFTSRLPEVPRWVAKFDQALAYFRATTGHLSDRRVAPVCSQVAHYT